MSDKFYEWTLKAKNGFTVRQGVVCARNKKDVEVYLNSSFNEDEKELQLNNKLIISVLGDIK